MSNMLSRLFTKKKKEPVKRDSNVDKLKSVQPDKEVAKNVTGEVPLTNTEKLDAVRENIPKKEQESGPDELSDEQKYMQAIYLISYLQPKDRDLFKPLVERKFNKGLSEDIDNKKLEANWKYINGQPLSSEERRVLGVESVSDVFGGEVPEEYEKYKDMAFDKFLKIYRIDQVDPFMRELLNLK